MSYENEMTAHSTPVGAGDEQSSTKYLDTSIADDLSDFNSLDAVQRTVSVCRLAENRQELFDGAACLSYQHRNADLELQGQQRYGALPCP